MPPPPVLHYKAPRTSRLLSFSAKTFILLVYHIISYHIIDLRLVPPLCVCSTPTTSIGAVHSPTKTTTRYRLLRTLGEARLPDDPPSPLHSGISYTELDISTVLHHERRHKQKDPSLDTTSTTLLCGLSWFAWPSSIG